MPVKRILTILMIGAAVCGAARPALAQLTTGTVTGTVADSQSAVVPGATVTLTSETRGTQMPPAFTNASGDFVLANVPPDTYTLQVTMEGFKTLKRSGIAVSRRRPRRRRDGSTIELGGLTESVSVKAEAPLVQTQSGERSFTVTTKSVENLPISNRSFVQLASLAPGVTGTNPTRVGDRSSTGGNNSNIMMDGVSTMDTGSNSVLLQMNVESIAEVKVLVSNYQAEYGRSSGVQVSAVTKSGTNRFRGSAYGVMRKDALEREQRDQHPQRRPEGEGEREGSRLYDRRSDRQAGRQQQAVLLLRARVRAAHRAAATPCASASRPRSSGPATSRRRLDNNGNLVSVHQGSAAAPAPCSRDQHRGLLPVRRGGRPHSRRTGSIRPA